MLINISSPSCYSTILSADSWFVSSLRIVPVFFWTGVTDIFVKSAGYLLTQGLQNC